jgi:hypothetical protein
MQKQKQSTSDTSQTTRTDNSKDAENIKAAHDEAESDIANDPDLSIHSPNDDLDEGETARLGEDKTDLV